MTSFAGASPPRFPPSPARPSPTTTPLSGRWRLSPPRSGLQVPHFRRLPPHGGAFPSPRSLPKWLRWLAVAALVFVVGAVVLHLTTRGVAVCPPVVPAVPAKPEETTLRLAKDDAPIVVKVQGLQPDDGGNDWKSCPEDLPHDGRAPCEQGPGRDRERNAAQLDARARLLGAVVYTRVGAHSEAPLLRSARSALPTQARRG